jgi:predicted lipoprotein
MTFLLTMPRRGSLTIASALALTSCSDATRGPEESHSPETVAVQAALIEHTAAWVGAAYDDFDAAVVTLVEATGAYADGLEDVDRVAAQDAWLQAAGEWQRAEAALLGPAAAMGSSVGGEDLRDAIYSWPVVNSCRVDQETVTLGFSEGLASLPVNVRGLDGLEYLLFIEGRGNACEPNSAINRDGDWLALAEGEIAQRRADYASAAALDVQASSMALVAAWAEFAVELRAAGESSALFARQREAINAISDALFYIDTDVKDMKVAVPAGLTDCPETTCPERLESSLSKASLAHVRANVAAFLELFGETDSVGFYALLAHHGVDTLGSDIAAATQEALALLDGLEGTFVSTLEREPERVVEIYNAIKVVTDLLKTEFVSVLDLDLPDRAAGDND